MSKKILNAFIWIILIVVAIFTLLPFVWMLITSVKSSGNIYQMPPEFFVKNPRFENYSDVVKMVPIFRYFINSALISLLVTVGTLITTIFASYAFARYEFKGKEIIFTIIVATMMVPGEVLIAPNFVTISKLGLLNTMTALYLPWIASAFSIFLLRQYFLQVPEELYKASKIDGASEMDYLFRILVPYSKPALITIGLLRIINSWNEFLWPLLMVNETTKRTLPVGLTTFVTEAGTKYNLLMAYASIVVIPIILIYILCHNYIIQGFSRGGLKG